MLFEKQPMSSSETCERHGVLERFGARIVATSEGLGWSSSYASMQRERPFEGHYGALSDCLMVLHRGGPVDVEFKQGRHLVSRHVPKGGIFFLPGGQECTVHLRGSLDTIHIYLRSRLFVGDSGPSDPVSGLAPIFGERDPVIQHLADAVGEIVAESAPSLSIDQVAQALAGRLLDINFRKPIVGSMRRDYRLSERQIRLVQQFIEANIHTNIRLDMLAAICGVSPDYFLRMFKATMGVSPYQYVLNLRVEFAKQLLSEQSLSLAEIALRCGFSHQEHLNRVFRRFTGVTPGRYRGSY